MAKAKPKTTETTENLVISPPNLKTIEVPIQGTAPLVQHKFSKKAQEQMLQAQQATAKKTKKEPRDIQADFEEASHRTPDGRYGIPAPAFRSAMISACRIAGFQMTKAKLSVFVEPDEFSDEGTPLVLLDGNPEPEMHKAAVRLESGVASIAIRPMWKKWAAKVKITFDGDQFSPNDVINLLHRAGLQVGVGEGRPDSKKSHGMGWGTFSIVEG